MALLKVQAETHSPIAEELKATLHESAHNVDLPADLWDKAYELLNSREELLIKEYENILEKEWRTSGALNAVMRPVTAIAMSIVSGKEKPSTTGIDGGDRGTSETISWAVAGTPRRQEQMKALVESKIEKHKESAWKFKIGSKDIILRDQTEKFVNSILFAKSFVDFAVSSAGEPHVAMAWAGVCILLPLLVIPSKQRAAHAKGLAEVADLIHYYSAVEKVYRGKILSNTIDQGFKDQFEANLTTLYSKILQFQAKTICQLSSNAFTQTFTLPSTWDGLISEIKISHASCMEKARLLTDYRINEVRIGIQDMSEYLKCQFEKMRSEIQDMSQYLNNRLEKMEDAQMRRNIYDWLLPPRHRSGEDPLEVHERHCANREPGTCQWFVEGSYFKEWLKSTRRSLWVYGDVGCGKTILCASIIEKIKEVSLCQELCRATLDSTNVSQSSIAYFYFTFDTTAAQDSTSFLKTIIAQLCLGDRVLPQLLELFKRLQEWRAPSYDNLYDTVVSVITGSVSTSSASQRHSDSQNGKEGSVFLVLDGLDEISKWRDQIFKLLHNLASLESSRLRIIITSRPKYDIRAVLKLPDGSDNYEIPASEIERDVQSYLSAQIAADSRLSLQSNEVKETICERLSQGGVFRLAALQMQVLKDYPLINLTMHSLAIILKKLPEELATCYSRILEKIPLDPPELRSSFFTALKWITLAQRPLYAEEVAEACMINVSRNSVDTERGIKSRDIVETLSGLIKLKPKPRIRDNGILPRRTYVVSLAHFSVQEYLIVNVQISSTSSLGRFEPGLAQSFIAQSCLIYVYICSLSPQKEQGMDIWPLKDYAWHYWAAHAQATCSCLLGIHIQPGALRLFNEIAFPQLYRKSNRLEGRDSFFFVLYEEMRRCLPAPKHPALLAALQDPKFPEDYISIIRDGYEFQASKKRPDVTEIMAEPEPLLTNEVSFEEESMTYIKCQAGQKLSLRPLMSGPEIIRLLIIHPNPNESAKIQCSLCMDSLHNKPRYIALAYAWGKNTRATAILVNGQSCYIRTNLHAALVQLRDKEQPRVVWVDAVCIDMWNLSEKGSQVRLMTEVYSGAEEVSVWLGTTEGTNEDRAYHESNEVRGYSRSFAGLRIVGKAKPQLQYISKAATDSRFSENAFRDLDAIFDRRFWKSSWIVQEVVVAKRVVVRLGHQAIDWDDIIDVRRLYEMRVPPILDDYVAQRIGDIRITGGSGPFPFHLGWAAVETLQYLRKEYQNGQELTLPELLNLTRYHYSTDARDKIFAIFSILPPHQRKHELLQPDYSLDISEVYTRAAEYILEVYENLDIFSACPSIPKYYEHPINDDRQTRRRKKIPPVAIKAVTEELPYEARSPFPSWVPVWTRDSGLPLAPGIFAPNQIPLFNAGGSKIKFRLGTHDDLRVLTITGVIVDRIGDFEFARADFSTARILAYPKSHTDDSQSPTRYPAGQTLTEVFWRTLLTDRWISPAGEITRVSLDASGLPYGPMRDEWSLKDTTEARLEKDLLCLKPFISAQGRALMMPWDAEPGDIIVILFGGKVPYVLSKDEFEGEYYNLVGECYVHGLMDGEVFQDSIFQTQEFHLV